MPSRTNTLRTSPATVALTTAWVSGVKVPDTLLAAVAKPNATTRWVFEQTTETAVRELLTRQGVPAAMVTRLLDPTSRTVQAYATVEAPYRYGDILCFLEGGEGLHTCVYVADDIVFTKNGDSILAPWVLMQVKDVEAIYRRSPDTRIQGFRLKR